MYMWKINLASIKSQTYNYFSRKYIHQVSEQANPKGQMSAILDDV